MDELDSPWYFTFGVAQYHAHDIVRICGTFESARERMVELFGLHWCAQYDEVDGLEQINKYHYHVINVFL